MRPTLLLVLVALLLPAAPAVAAKKVRKGPAGTAFYTPPSKLPGSKHGDAVWVRKLKGPAALKSAKANRLILYRSQRADGKVTAVSGIVSVPKGKAPKKGWPVITYAHGTTGIADQCAPSTRRDRQPGAPQHVRLPAAQPLAEGGLRRPAHGLQGPRHAGHPPVPRRHAEGRTTLDIVRAARKFDKHLNKPFAICGHSQGGHAALWAAKLRRSTRLSSSCAAPSRSRLRRTSPTSRTCCAR